MSILRVALIAVLASGCGRLGFDAQGDAGGSADACTGTCAQAFDPSTSGCTTADTGPFVARGSFPNGAGYGVWSAAPHLLAADTTGGLYSLRFDGSAFVENDHVTGIGWVEAVVSDGQYFYVGAPGTGLAVMSLDPTTGKLAMRTQNVAPLAEARHAWAANGVLYVPSGGDGLFALSFDGTTLAQLGAKLNSQSWSQGVFARGSRVYFADAARFRVVDFTGTGFTEAVTPDASHANSSRVWSDSRAIFVANADGVTAYRVIGSALTELDTFATTDTARDVWSDGQHVFVAAESAGVYALAFTNDQFTLVDQIDVGGTALGVFGDGTYIYSNALTGGVRAFSGFACRSW